MRKSKIYQWIYGYAVLTALFTTSSAKAVGTNPAIAQVRIYGVAVSHNYDCSNATVVGYRAAGATYDFLQNPAIVSGNIPAGTYPCVILYMDNLLTFTPATSETTHPAGCVAGTSYSRIICSASGCTYTQAAITNGSSVTYTGTGTPRSATSRDIATPDKVLLFLSTASTGTGSGAFLQPTGATASVTSPNGIHLGAPFVVPASGGAGTFVVNFNGQVNSQNDGSCDLGAPTFTFR